MPSTGPIPSVTANQLTRALGEAVIRIWSNLPQAVQNHLFQEAVTSHGESIRLPLAVFLYDKHARTWGPLGNPREMTEPDSLGGLARLPPRESRNRQVISRDRLETHGMDKACDSLGCPEGRRRVTIWQWLMQHVYSFPDTEFVPLACRG